jgi:hypothetical protein
MSQEQINLNPDLRQLKDNGYAVEIRDGYLLIHEIPYLNPSLKVKRGILVSDLSSIAGNATNSPVQQHVAYFVGELPHSKAGKPLSGIVNASTDQIIGSVTVNHTLSSKPINGYLSYFEKMSTYATIISSHAKAVDVSVNEKPHMSIDSTESVFKYPDTNSSRANIGDINSKLKGLKIAILGLGGTGSYILDMVTKTPVEEIHLFDGDVFLNHNAFRSPGAPALSNLGNVNSKADYFAEIYLNMRKNIISHNYKISNQNLGELLDMDFIFISIDNNNDKKDIVEFLVEKEINFIDNGIGLIVVDDSIIGQVRITACTREKHDHINRRIDLGSTTGNNDYSTNIQIAELNALNAALAVIQWKKMLGFYQHQDQHFNDTFSINDGKLINDEYLT